MSVLLATFAGVLLLFAGEQTLAEWKTQGEALKRRGDAAGALAAYEKAAGLAPKSGEIEGEIGFLLAVLRRPDEAKAHFRRAIQLKPDLASAHYHLGVLHWLE